MSVPTMRLEPLEGIAAPQGWHYDDPVLEEKLAASLRRHGQVRPLVVRKDLEGNRTLVDGRYLLKAMRALGWTEGWVADVGTVDDEGASRMALDLETRFEVDYVRVAKAVAWLVDDREADPGSLSAASPFTAARILHLRGLATFDWGQFTKPEDDGQSGFSWADDPTVPLVSEGLVEALQESDRVLAEQMGEVAAAAVLEEDRKIMGVEEAAEILDDLRNDRVEEVPTREIPVVDCPVTVPDDEDDADDEPAPVGDLQLGLFG